LKTYRRDKWARFYDGALPDGAVVTVLRNFPKRRVLIEHAGRRYLTFQWCLRS